MPLIPDREMESLDRRRPLAGLLALAATMALAGATPALARAQKGSAAMTALPLEELLNIEVTSVSKRAEPLAETAASVYVLTGEDIRRSGAATIPDALRMVPGLHVGQIDANGWSVAVRGFGGRFANKLLVLVDGQSVYSPLFSGVHWNTMSMSLGEIERIEIVRGPGATLWGANAVNGVVNIITRSAASAQGTEVSAETGNHQRGSLSVQHGGRLGARSAYSINGGAFQRSGTSAGESRDAWSGARLGGRIDGEIGSNQDYSLIGSALVTHADELWQVPTLQAPYVRPTVDRGANSSLSLLGRWNRSTDGGKTTLQAVAARSTLHELPLHERRLTADLDAQHSVSVGGWNELVFGGNYRHTRDHATSTPLVALDPERRTMRFWSVFVQDEVSLGSRVRFTLGSKFEHNDYTGWETQPSIRGRVRVSNRQAIWGSVARAVRLPSRAEFDGQLEPSVLPPSAQVPLPQLISLRHDSAGLASERLVAYEVGYRAQPAATLSLDASVFVNDYDRLLSNVFGKPYLALAPAPHMVVPVVFTNRGEARLVGGEVMAEWRPASGVRVQGGYSRVATAVRLVDPADAAPRNDYPVNQFHLHGGAILFRRLELDAMARFVGELKVMQVPSYAALDARVGVRLGRLELSVVGRNLLGPEHCEYVPDVLFSAQTNILRRVGLNLLWRF